MSNDYSRFVNRIAEKKAEQAARPAPLKDQNVRRAEVVVLACKWLGGTLVVGLVIYAVTR